MATLVERKTRFVMLVKVDRPDAETVADALIRAIHRPAGRLERQSHLGPRR
ncbi:MAG: hypothetical protein AAGD10_12100 [Myxococcota bacterium]